MVKQILLIWSLMLLIPAAAVPLRAQERVTTPKEHFGSNVGDDYFLANYEQMLRYWKTLDGESDRLTLVDIGETTEGRPMVMAILTSAANQQALSRYKDIA